MAKADINMILAQLPRERIIRIPFQVSKLTACIIDVQNLLPRTLHFFLFPRRPLTPHQNTEMREFQSQDVACVRMDYSSTLGF